MPILTGRSILLVLTLSPSQIRTGVSGSGQPRSLPVNASSRRLQVDEIPGEGDLTNGEVRQKGSDDRDSDTRPGVGIDFQGLRAGKVVVPEAGAALLRQHQV